MEYYFLAWLIAFSSVSRYKRVSKRANYNAKDISLAIKAVIVGTNSVRVAAGQSNVPRSSLTRYIEKVSEKYNDLSAGIATNY